MVNLRRWFVAGVLLLLAARGAAEAPTPIVRYGESGSMYAKSGLEATGTDATTPSLTFEGDEVPTVTDFEGEDGAVVTTDGRTVTVSASGALDTSEVTTGEDEPLTATVSLGTVEIITTGGVHNVPTTLEWDADTDRSGLLVLGAFAGPGAAAAALDAVPSPTVPFELHAPMIRATADPGFPFPLQERYKEPDSYLDIYRGYDFDGERAYRFAPTGITIDGVGVAASSFYGATEFDVNGNGAISGDLTVVNSATVGSPSGGALAYGFPGTINGEAGLFSGSLHAENNGYMRKGLIVGNGRQKWWNAVTYPGAYGLSSLEQTPGSGVAPVPHPHCQQFLMHTDAGGTNYLNHSGAAIVGAIASEHRFDDSVRTSTTLISDRASGAGLTVAANGTIGGTLGVADTLSATKAIGFGLIVADDASVGGTLSVADALTATKASGTGLAVTSNATVGGTLVSTGKLGRGIASPTGALDVRVTGSLFGICVGQDVTGNTMLRADTGINAAANVYLGDFNTAGVISSVKTAVNARLGVGTATPPTAGAFVQTTSLSINGGSTIANYKAGTGTLDFGSIAAGASASLTITVTGAAAGDYVIPKPPAALEAGLVFSAVATAANTVEIRQFNSTGAPIDPASATWGAACLN